MGVDTEQILPVTIWSKNEVSHKISCIAVSPCTTHIVTGSWDGNLCVVQFGLPEKTLEIRWMSSSAPAAVSAIACFHNFFIAFYHDGLIRHYELPSGNLLLSEQNEAYVHTNAAIFGDDLILCSGYYPDLVLIDPVNLQIKSHFQSRLQSDWVSCFKVGKREHGLLVQALTFSGVLKTWMISDTIDDIMLENSSGPLNLSQCLSMSFHMDLRLFLLVTRNIVTVFDRGIVTLFQYESKEALGGGDFIGENVIFWTKKGEVFICELKNDQCLTKVIETRHTDISVPANSIVFVNDTMLFFNGDLNGCVSVWLLDAKVTNEVKLLASINVSGITNNSSGLFDNLNLTVTCSVHIATTNQFVAGCFDGSLVIFNAIDLIHYQFINDKVPDYTFLLGHRKAIRCILHPHSERKVYDENMLVTGSDDFSVCLWDINKNVMLNRFCLHSGPVLKLLRPPADCNIKMVHAICSIAGDHSIAIINLREQRCFFFASHHPFPIVTIRWKPLHDFMIVKCFDGSVFVWEVKTGVLDRVLAGVEAEEVMFDCEREDDNLEDDLWNFNINRLYPEELARKPLQIDEPRVSLPIHIRSFLSSPYAESHVLCLNISKLTTLLDSTGMSQDTNNVMCQSVQNVIKPPDSVLQKVIDVIKAGKFKFSSTSLSQKQYHSNERNMTKDVTDGAVILSKLALSLLHLWDFDNVLDEHYRTMGCVQPKIFLQTDLIMKQDIFCFRAKNSTQISDSIFRLVALSALTHSLETIIFKKSIDLTDSLSCNLLLTKNEFYSDFDIMCVEKLAAIWLNPCYSIKLFARKALPKCLHALKTDKCFQLLTKWQKYLPSTVNKQDNTLGEIAIVILGLLVIDFKISDENSDTVNELCSCLYRLLLLSPLDESLEAVSVEFIGRGFSIFQKSLPLVDILIPLLALSSDKNRPHSCTSALNTLKVIAEEKLDEFIAFVKCLCKTTHPVLEKCKPEIVKLIQEIIFEFPFQMSSLLSDAVEILIFCIDESHLRSNELISLLPTISKLDLVHHSLVGQRIAVGVPNGKVVVHDLRSHRSHVYQAHIGEVSALCFSPDGKHLLTVSSGADISVWQLGHGFFDLVLGQFRFRCVKTFSSMLNKFDIDGGIDIAWSSNTSIKLGSRKDSSKIINLSL